MLTPSTPVNRRYFKPFYQGIHALVIETHAIDQGFLFHQAEQARPGVAGLGLGSHRADLDGAEADGGESGYAYAVFVHSRREPHRVGELQSHDRYRFRGQGLPQGIQRAQPRHLLHGYEPDGVGGFRVQFEEDGAQDFVEHGSAYALQWKGLLQDDTDVLQGGYVQA